MKEKHYRGNSKNKTINKNNRKEIENARKTRELKNIEGKLPGEGGERIASLKPIFSFSY
jgi:hypothetical protein